MTDLATTDTATRTGTGTGTGADGDTGTRTTSEPVSTERSAEDSLNAASADLEAARQHLANDDATLRLSETEAEQMIINMGPQHPSTHGVLRLMLELEGETVLRSKPVIGYLHTGMEKTGEELTYLQGGTNVTRMDYAQSAVQRAGVLPGDREAAGDRGARLGPVDPNADVRAEPHELAHAVPGHQRHGPRCGR
jgi:hypothetical protein